MDNQNLASGLPGSKKTTSKSWIFLIIVIALGIAAAAYYFYLSNRDAESTDNVTVNNTNTVNNANTIVNNGNLNTNETVVTNTTLTKTITFQRLDHGFTIKLPANWLGDIYGMGNQEQTNLVSFSYSNADYTDSLNGSVQYYNNTGSLPTWVTAHANSLKKDNYTISTPTEITINGQVAWTLLSTYRSTYDVNGNSHTDTTITRYSYVQRGNRVYEINIGGDQTSTSRHEAEINAIINSFTFIDPIPTVTLADFAISQKAIAKNSYKLSINWATVPTELNLINDPFIGAVGVLSRTYEKVGTVTNGVYKDKALLNIYETEDGPASGPTLFRAIYDSQSQTLVYLMGKDDYQPEGIDIAKDNSSSIPELTYPTEIKIPNSAIVLAEQAYNTTTKYSSLTQTEKQFTDSVVGDVYLDLNGKCFFIKTADGLVKRYHVKVNFAKVETVNSDYPADPNILTPLITWNNGQANTVEYQTRDINHGCSGFASRQDLRTTESLGSLAALKVAGQTSTGDKIYEYIDSNTKELKDAYDLVYAPQGEDKPTYEVYAQNHPLIFWQEPLGQWIAFRNMTYQPGVECGKPVIYLYPEQTTKVNVKVQPLGGLTITEPFYPENGWTVTAQPNGQLTTEDGAYYPYLFWEGIGLNYQLPDRGFVVARNDVNKFLKDKLALLGLNEQESADFIDFWQAKLEVKPYAFVTFIDQPVFDQLAPLSVTPKPDQVIRVFMDYQPLDAPISVQPLTIKTPVRHGFTVVEWGGALHH